MGDNGSDDSESIADDVEVDLPGQQQHAPPKRKRDAAVTTVGSYILVLIVSSAAGTAGLWHGCGNCGIASDDSLQQCPAGHAIALALTRWTFYEHGHTKIPKPLLRLERLRSRAQDHYGFIGYPLCAIARFEQPFHVDSEMSARQLMDQVCLLHARSYDFDINAWADAACALQELVAQWQTRFVMHSIPTFIKRQIYHEWISFVLLFLPAVFHIVSISLKVARNRLFGKTPSRHSIKQLMTSSCAEGRVVAAAPRVRCGWENMHPIETILEWLNFGKYIKSQDNSWQATQAAARVLARSTGRSFKDVLGDARGCSGKVLRLARIKLDCLSLMLFRLMFRNLTNIAIYIYLDSSPQTRGHELFAASFEVWDLSGQFPFERRLFTLLSLPRDYLDASGKALALLWAIFLLVGPHYADVRRFCDSIICIVTDMGTERLIARIPNFLEDFYSLLLNVQIKNPIHRQYLLPFAMQSPGWQHGWDIVLKRGMKCLPWFASWLEGMRSIVNFFRAKILVEGFVTKLARTGYHAACAMIQAVSLPSIAEWRWGTLHSACQELSKVLGTLRVHFDVSLFGNARDPSRLQKAASAIASSAWAWQFKYIMWFCNWICSIQAWGKGSTEIESRRRSRSGNDDAATIDPMKTGRRLSEAEVHIQRHLQGGLDETRSWDLNTFTGCSSEDFQYILVSVRSSYSLAMKRFEYIGLLPWLLARLPEPGIRDRCVTQYRTYTKHHPLTDKFLAPDGELRQHVDAMRADGTGISSLLRSWIDVVHNVPMDDSVAESPHAVGNRLGRSAPRSGIAWAASSMRLLQNLRDVHDHSQALQADLQQLWLTHSSILQSQRHKLQRPMRMQPKEFSERLYIVGKISESSLDAVAEADGSDNDHDQAQQPDEQQDQERCDDDQQHLNPRMIEPANKQSLSLMREYLLASLCPGMYVSMPSADTSDDHDPYLFAQVLAVEQKVTTAQTCIPKSENPDACFLSVSMQQFERMLQFGQDPAFLDEAHLFVFQDEVPIDIQWAACVPGDRCKFLQWDHLGESSNDGCFVIGNPRTLQPHFDLMDNAVPTLMLLDSLGDRGWEGRQQITTHNDESPLVYDCRKPLSKRTYFQCLVVSAQLFEAGVQFKSGRPSTYYAYVLKFRRVPAIDQSMACLRKAIQHADGISDVDWPPVSAPVAPRPPIADDDEIAWDEPMPEPTAARPAPIDDPIVVGDVLEPSAEVAVVLHGNDDDSDSVAAEVPPAPGAVVPVPLEGDWPSTLEGVELKRFKGRHGGKHGFAARLGVACPCCRLRSRSVALLTAELGPKAPLCFLGAWLEQFGELAPVVHKDWTPSLDDMKSYKARKLAD